MTHKRPALRAFAVAERAIATRSVRLRHPARRGACTSPRLPSAAVTDLIRSVVPKVLRIRGGISGLTVDFVSVIGGSHAVALRAARTASSASDAHARQSTNERVSLPPLMSAMVAQPRETSPQAS